MPLTAGRVPRWNSHMERQGASVCVLGSLSLSLSLFLSLSLSLSLLFKPSGFNNEESFLMALSNPNHFPKKSY
jgi:hypothetical protein